MPKTTPTMRTADGPGSARIGADDKLWAALRAHPGGTCVELATAAGIGRSTAAKILARWAADNTVVRTTTTAIGGGAGRAPELWTIPDPATPVADAATPGDTPLDDQPAARPVHEEASSTQDGAAVDDDAAPTGDTVIETDDQSTTDATIDHAVAAGDDPGGVIRPTEGTAPARRLPAGGLRGIVEDYLSERPGQAFGPSQIGKALARSSGAVANALVKLVGAGCVVVVQDRPLRYALAPAGDTEPEATRPISEPVDDAIR